MLEKAPIIYHIIAIIEEVMYMKYRIALAGFCGLILSCATNQAVTTDTKEAVQEKTQSEPVAVVQKAAPKTVEVKIPVETKATVKFADGSVDEYTVSVWDNSYKNLQAQTRYTASGAVLEKTEFVYENNLLVGKTIRDREDKIVSRRSYAYTPAGLVSAEVVYDANGKQVSGYEYVYDAQNNKIAWIVKDANNSKVAETRYSYKDGNVQSAELFDAMGKKNGSSVYEYDAEGNLASVSYYNGLGSLLRKEFSYWDKGLLVKEERTSAGGQVLQRTTYEYGPNKELVRKVVEDLQGKSKQTIEFEYAIRTETRIVE
jgi:hypothetical protein